jgi:uncharacterized protein (TIGR02284 family)
VEFDFALINGAKAGKCHGGRAEPLAKRAVMTEMPRTIDGAARWLWVNLLKKGRKSMSTSAFKSLTDTTFDSVEGYRKAADKADSPQLKQALQQRCEQREQTLQQMNAELQRQGAELVTEGTLAGEAHQVWQSITSAFESDDEAAAERVEEGEDYLRGKFEAALESDQLEAQERAIVQQGYDDICQGERFGDIVSQQYG